MRILYFIFYIFVFLFYPIKTIAVDNIPNRSAILKIVQIKTRVDERIIRLQRYLEKYNSPLLPHAQFIVYVADAYRIPWYLVPAIAGVESTFCRHIPYNSFNCWGWNNGTTYFVDYEDAIYTVTKGLKYGYFDRNLRDPNAIGPVYAPPSKSWAGKVTHFSEQIKSFKINSSIPDFSL